MTKRKKVGTLGTNKKVTYKEEEAPPSIKEFVAAAIELRLVVDRVVEDSAHNDWLDDLIEARNRFAAVCDAHEKAGERS
jgi:hypothetical protein